jgi:alkyl sulfatase BDS1-like metallo-beta-lactamase superfamily hydrolase
MTNSNRQLGAINKWLGLILAVIAVGVLWLFLDEDAGRGLKKEAQLKTLEVIGDAAAKRMAGMSSDGEGTHGSAVDLISRPIEVRKISDNAYYTTGVGNTFMITTSEGNVIFDTGLVIQSAKQLKLLKAEVSDAPVRYVIVSHSHADHSGGTKLWLEEGTEVIAHTDFEEEQRYLTELQPYFWGRNRTLFPWMPEGPSDIEIMRYGGVEPDIRVADWEVHEFTLGGIEFQVIGTPGAEGADNIVLWLPQQKMLFSGDFYGPQFPQFPNVFTMRGEKVRKPMEYVKSLNLLLALKPETVAPSHLNPTVGAQEIAASMTRIRDAVQYVHDETIAGMNAGKSVYDLMKEIQLPAHLELPQNHGKVDWAVKSIWEYYATWFHFDSTTELYPVPARDVYADLAEAAGAEALLSLSRNYLNQGEPVKALHVIEVTLASQPTNKEALGQRREALAVLMQRAEAGMRNDYEIYWLKTRMADTDSRLEVAP